MVWDYRQGNDIAMTHEPTEEIASMFEYSPAEKEAIKLAQKANECCHRNDGYEEDTAGLIRTALLAAERRGEERMRERAADFAERHAIVVPDRLIAIEPSDQTVKLATAIRSLKLSGR
jgi:hypothetical protein